MAPAGETGERNHRQPGTGGWIWMDGWIVDGWVDGCWCRETGGDDGHSAAAGTLFGQYSTHWPVHSSPSSTHQNSMTEPTPNTDTCYIT